VGQCQPCTANILRSARPHDKRPMGVLKVRPEGLPPRCPLLQAARIDVALISGDFPCADRRAPDELRAVSLERGAYKYAEWSCMVKFGDTHVLLTCHPGRTGGRMLKVRARRLSTVRIWHAAARHAERTFLGVRVQAERRVPSRSTPDRPPPPPHKKNSPSPPQEKKFCTPPPHPTPQERRKGIPPLPTPPPTPRAEPLSPLVARDRPPPGSARDRQITVHCRRSVRPDGDPPASSPGCWGSAGRLHGWMKAPHMRRPTCWRDNVRRDLLRPL